jgi:hypothetical protein
MELLVCHPSPPNTYSYVQEENSGSTRKFIENYSLFTCIANQILALQMQTECGWAGETLQKQREKSSSSPCAVGVFTASVCLSVCLFFHVN